MLWVNRGVSPFTLYACSDNTPGAAQWIQVGSSGNVDFNFRGDWVSSDSYFVNDIVAYQGGSYLALEPSLGVPPSSLAPYWGQLAAPGLSEAEADTLYRTKGSFLYTQGVAAAIWTINHNLGTYPAVTVMDSTNTIVETAIAYIDSNSLTSSSIYAFSGTAILT